MYVIKLNPKERWSKREETTLGVWWNLIGQEGNISRVAAGLASVNKAANKNLPYKHSKIFQGTKPNIILHNIASKR